MGVNLRVERREPKTCPQISEKKSVKTQRGLKAVLVGAGGTPHLAGVIAAETTLSVIFS